MLTAIVCFVSCLMLLSHFALSPATAAEKKGVEDIFAPPRVKLRKVESIQLPPQSPLGPAEATRVKELIKSLANIDKPNFGFSSTFSGHAFAPIANAREMGAFLLAHHGTGDSPEFTELVKLGPSALPFLLDALEDKIPTKLDINHATGFGAMWFANELRGNPANTNEQKALGVPAKLKDLPHGDHISTYTVKVGDVCLVIIGQIVGRSYQTVRYQPTACIIINSPTHDAELARQVRAIWSSTNAHQHLLDSLLFDFASEGVFHGKTLDGWGVGSGLQCGAAMRLLFYFPKQTADLIAERLSRLDVRATGPGSGSRATPEEMQLFLKREVTNGVRTVDFIKAVVWCDQPAVRTELQRIFTVTGDPDILRLSLAAMDRSKPEAHRQRLEEFLAKLPETGGGPFGDGYNLLVEIGTQFGADAKPAFQRYLQHASLQRLRSMSHVLRKTRGEWAIELLAPLLDDKRPANGWTYAVNPGQNEPRLPIRISDEAAETIAGNFPKLSFKMAGQHEDLDRQIQVIRERIERKEY